MSDDNSSNGSPGTANRSWPEEPATREPSPGSRERVDQLQKTFEQARKKDSYALSFMVNIVSASINAPAPGARKWKTDTERAWENVVYRHASPELEPGLDLPPEPAPITLTDVDAPGANQHMNRRATGSIPEVLAHNDHPDTLLERPRSDMIAYEHSDMYIQHSQAKVFQNDVAQPPLKDILPQKSTDNDRHYPQSASPGSFFFAHPSMQDAGSSKSTPLRSPYTRNLMSITRPVLKPPQSPESPLTASKRRNPSSSPPPASEDLSYMSPPASSARVLTSTPRTSTRVPTLSEVMKSSSNKRRRLQSQNGESSQVAGGKPTPRFTQDRPTYDTQISPLSSSYQDTDSLHSNLRPLKPLDLIARRLGDISSTQSSASAIERDLQPESSSSSLTSHARYQSQFNHGAYNERINDIFKDDII